MALRWEQEQQVKRTQTLRQVMHRYDTASQAGCVVATPRIHTSHSHLEQLCEYTGDDVADMFPLDWPREHELAELPPEGRAEYVQGYVRFYFEERFAAQACE